MVSRTPLFSFLFCLLFTQLTAQEIKLKKGQEFILESIHQLSREKSSNNSSNVYAFKVIDIYPSGNYLLEVKLVDSKQKMVDNNRTMGFNTDSIGNNQLQSSLSVAKLAMLSQPFTLTLSPKGKVIEVKGIEKLMQEGNKRWDINQSISKQLIANVSSFPTLIQPMFFQLPDKQKLKKGSEWVNLKDSSTYLVKESNKEYILISSDKKSIKLESKTLLPLSMQAKHSDAETNTQQNRKTIRLYNKKPSVIDTAWINFAVNGSHWSDKLKQNGEYDSLKVIRFIDKNKTLFANSPVYIDRMGHLLQSVGARKDYEQFLKSTPNSLLRESSSHLHNKLGDIYRSDAKDAFEIVKIMDEYHPNSLYGWVQHGFSQAFLNEQRLSDAEKTEVYELLNSCMNDTSKSLRRQMAPLNVWVNAKAHKKDKAALDQATTEIGQMDESYWKESNLGRYALLTYKLLADAGDSARAETLLNDALLQLGEAVNDSLNKHRLAHRNILAYAYYLKHREALSTDSTAALEYLAKAADFSPKSSAKKAYGSFYDRVFLQSKKSYQVDYMKALSHLGRTEDALAVLVAEFNANPITLPKLKTFYQTSFPDKDFKTFFAGEVVGNWNEAPSFTLSNLTDQSVSLKNYAGKWLVLDFWGTWCGPCKREMPDINAFYQKLKSGTFPGVDFLSIACYDTKQKVLNYLNANSFYIPAVISDGKIQETYKIRGYPTKVLVSPDGKMKMLRFGAKWEEIVEQLNEAYPGKTKQSI